MYGFLLNNMGFDTSHLFYAIVVADTATRLDGGLKTEVLNAISEYGPEEGILELDNVRVFICKYNHEDAERDLNWAVRFWKNERAAIPTQNLNKCRSCEYSEKCQVWSNYEV